VIQYTCLMVLPVAIARRMSDLSGKPKATIEDGSVVVELIFRMESSGDASPRARMPYWRIMSKVRRPTKRDVPNGEERLIREISGILACN